MSLRNKIIKFIVTRQAFTTLELINAFPKYDKQVVRNTVGRMKRRGDIETIGYIYDRGTPQIMRATGKLVLQHNPPVATQER